MTWRDKHNGHNGTALDSLAHHRTAVETVFDLCLSDLHFRAIQAEQMVTSAEAKEAMRRAIGRWLGEDGYELRQKARGKR